MDNTVMEMKDYIIIMKIMFKAVEATVARGYGGKKDCENPNFRMQMASSAGAPIRSMMISGGMKGSMLPDMLGMANGHFFRGIWKIIKGYPRSYHGKRLDALAEEARRTFSRFPRTTRVVFDHRGLGDAFPQFLAQPWINLKSGKEHPPWTLDDERTIIHNAVPILRSVKASAQINQQRASCLRVASSPSATVRYRVSYCSAAWACSRGPSPRRCG